MRTATGMSMSLGHKPAEFYTTRDKAEYWDGENEAGEFAATKKMVVAK